MSITLFPYFDFHMVVSFTWFTITSIEFLISSVSSNPKTCLSNWKHTSCQSCNEVNRSNATACKKKKNTNISDAVMEERVHSEGRGIWLPPLSLPLVQRIWTRWFRQPDWLSGWRNCEQPTSSDALLGGRVHNLNHLRLGVGGVAQSCCLIMSVRLVKWRLGDLCSHIQRDWQDVADLHFSCSNYINTHVEWCFFLKRDNQIDMGFLSHAWFPIMPSGCLEWNLSPELNPPLQPSPAGSLYFPISPLDFSPNRWTTSTSWNLSFLQKI